MIAYSSPYCIDIAAEGAGRQVRAAVGHTRFFRPGILNGIVLINYSVTFRGVIIRLTSHHVYLPVGHCRSRRKERNRQAGYGNIPGICFRIVPFYSGAPFRTGKATADDVNFAVQHTACYISPARGNGVFIYPFFLSLCRSPEQQRGHNGQQYNCHCLFHIWFFLNLIYSIPGSAMKDYCSKVWTIVAGRVAG